MRRKKWHTWLLKVLVNQPSKYNQVSLQNEPSLTLDANAPNARLPNQMRGTQGNPNKEKRLKRLYLLVPLLQEGVVVLVELLQLQHKEEGGSVSGWEGEGKGT